MTDFALKLALHERTMRSLGHGTIEPPRFEAPDIDRDDPLWQRIRAACCDITGLPGGVDRHAAEIYRTVRHLTQKTSPGSAQTGKGARGRGQTKGA